MEFTAQLAASTPSPTEATTVENSTKVATNAFKVRPALLGLNILPAGTYSQYQPPRANSPTYLR